MDSIFTRGVIFPLGKIASQDVFTGTAYVNMLLPDTDRTFDCQVYDVVFEAGARNNWHSHPGGQILLVTAGKGYYQEGNLRNFVARLRVQERGKPAQTLTKGDVVPIPPNVEHWHGAAQDSDFVHIGISPNTDKGCAVWLAPVTDAEYKEATK
jgi:quercetin dioxygenase-like cupin family protein